MNIEVSVDFSDGHVEVITVDDVLPADVTIELLQSRYKPEHVVTDFEIEGGTMRKCRSCNWEFDGTGTKCADCKINDGDALEVDPVRTAHVTYYPWTDGRAIGYRAVHKDGRIEYIYLNPSQDEEHLPEGAVDSGEICAGCTAEDNVPNVFLYTGTTGNIATDEPHVHFNMFES